MPNYELPVPVGTMVYVIEDCYCTPFWIEKCKMRNGTPLKNKCKALALIPTENRKGRAHCKKVYLRPFDPAKHLGFWGTRVFPNIQMEWFQNEDTIVFEQNMKRARELYVAQAKPEMSLDDALSFLTESNALDSLIINGWTSKDETEKLRLAIGVLANNLDTIKCEVHELDHASDMLPSEAAETLRDPDLWNALCECYASTEDAERFRTAISVASICLTAEAAEENNMSPREAHAILSDSSIWEAYWNNDITEEDNDDLCAAVQVALRCLAEKF